MEALVFIVIVFVIIVVMLNKGKEDITSSTYTSNTCDIEENTSITCEPITISNTDIELCDLEEKTLWKGRPAGLHLGNTEYIVTSERIIIKYGRWAKTEKEVELVDINNIVVDQSIGEKLMDKGFLKIYCKRFKIQLESVPNPYRVKKIIRNAMKQQKFLNKVIYQKIM